MRDEKRIGHCGQERRAERDGADDRGRPQLTAQDAGFDLGAREKRQHDAAEAGDEVDPGVRTQPDQIPGQDAEQNLDQSRSQADAP